MKQANKNPLDMKIRLITALWLCIALLLAFFIWDTQSKNTYHKQLEHQAFEFSEQYAKESEMLKQSFEQKYEVLLSQNKSLQDSITELDSIREHAAQKRSLAQSKVKHLSKTIKTQSDTVKKLEACDMLAEEFEHYVNVSSIERSLNLMTIDRLKRQVSLKDDIILLKSSEVLGTQHLLEQSISTQKVLEKEVKKRNRKLKRQRLKNKLTTAGAIIISSIATAIIVKR